MMPGFPFGPGPTEPNADARSSAASIWQLHCALREQGFTEEQSMFMIGQMLNGAAIGNALGQQQNGGT